MTDLRVGDIVEWDMFRGTDRGTVSKITETRIYVRNQRTNQRGRRVTRDCEFWWEVHEVDQLRRLTTPASTSPT